MPHWLVIGGITGGGGTHNKPNLAWPALLDAQLTVLFKNAVGPDYFLQCPETLMPARNQIDGVIYDFGPNMFGITAIHVCGVCQALCELLQITRNTHSKPRSNSAFVAPSARRVEEGAPAIIHSNTHLQDLLLQRVRLIIVLLLLGGDPACEESLDGRNVDAIRQ